MQSKTPLLQTITYSLISLAIITYLLKSASFIFIPIVWSVFLGISLMPLSNWLEARRFPRVLAILISIAMITLIAGSILYLFIYQLTGILQETSAIEAKLEAYLLGIQEYVTNVPLLGSLPEVRSLNLSALINGKNVNGFLQYTTGTILTLGIMPVYIFFFIYYKDFFNEFLKRVTAQKDARQLQWTKEAGHVVRGYLTGTFQVTLIVALMAGIVFYILGVKYFILFAFFIAVFNLIPYMGVFLSSAVSAFYVFLTTDSLWYPLLTLFLLWVIQLIENNLITPIVVGARLRLNPLAVIIAIMAGGWIWGLSGIILFIPLVGVLKIIFDNVDHLRPYGYLLGTDILIAEKNENFLKALKRKFKKTPIRQSA